MKSRALPAVLLLTLSLTACEGIDCEPTATSARDAHIVDLASVNRSGVLQARLTTQDERAVSGRVIQFYIEDESVGSDSTDARGNARLDLKNRPLKLPKGVTADSYTAAFSGDLTYCSSSGEATINVARTKK